MCFFKAPIFTFFFTISFFLGSFYIVQRIFSCYFGFRFVIKKTRYYEKDSQINDQHQQQIKSHHNKYEFDLERDHALPTSAPNADILKSNNNPTYPNPNRHHNHNHRHQNATPGPQGK